MRYAGFFEAAYVALVVHRRRPALTNRYFSLLCGYIGAKFNLRGRFLWRPTVLCPTMPGLFASLVSDLRALTSQDLHLDQLISRSMKTR